MSFIKKISSRKFIVFVFACVAVALGYIDGWQWVAVALIWVGGNSVDKYISILRAKGGENDTD